MARTSGLGTWLEQVAEAGLAGDTSKVQIVLLSAIRTLRKTDPELSQSLGELVGRHTEGTAGLRWKTAPPPPTEAEEGMALVRLASSEGALRPVLPPSLKDSVDQFITERRDAARLLKEGYVPPSSVLLVGAPGTGKTMLAKWLSSQLGLPLVVQDLAISISSLLGKTGFHLRRTLDYARSNPCLLLLDEFDAIAKRRDDATELGELKRIVNVLLKELEDWPLHSVLVAATNHPDLLDPAINRRFDLTLHLPLPGAAERHTIMSLAAGRFTEEIPKGVLEACSSVLGDTSASEVDKIVQASIRRHLSRSVPLAESLVAEIATRRQSDDERLDLGPLIRSLHHAGHGDLSVRDIAKLVGKTPSTVHHHLKKEESDG